MPLVFAKGEFESGLAAKRFNEFAADPYPYLDEAARKKMNTAQSDLLRRFTELAFDETAESRWKESEQTEADTIDTGQARNLWLFVAFASAMGGTTAQMTVENGMTGCIQVLLSPLQNGHG